MPARSRSRMDSHSLISSPLSEATRYSFLFTLRMVCFCVPAGLAQDPGATADQVVHLLLAGQVFAIFIVTVAAAEVALGVAIVIAVYRNRETVFVTDANQLRH